MKLSAPTLPDYEANKRERAQLKILWMSRPESRQAIYERCAADFVWWAEHFCFAHDEHADPKDRIRPLVLWEYQKTMAKKSIEEVMRCAQAHDEEWNAYGDKARKVAFTFTMLLVIQWLWQFHGISTVITSKTLDDTDTKGDMNTPFEKLRFQIEVQYKQAPWLFPPGFSITDKTQYKQCLIAIPGGGAQIAGIIPMGPAMRGARALIWFGDEFPHTKTDYELWDAACGTVKVRIVGGTPNRERGKACKAYRLRFNKDNENAHIFTIPWYEHPLNAQGLYKKPDGSYSSPWFDKQCTQKSRQTIATEYLMDWDVAQGAAALYAFREESARTGLKPDPLGGPIYRSWDPGKCYGVKWAQFDRYGRMLDLRELVMTEDDVISAGKTLLNAIAERAIFITEKFYKGLPIIDVGDPYGSRTQVSFQYKTEYEMLYENHKIRVQSAYMYNIPSNQRVIRRVELLNDLMGKDCITDDGKVTPMYLIDKDACPLTYEAIKTGYRWEMNEDGTWVEPRRIKKSHPDTEMIDTLGMIAIKEFDTSKTNKTGKGPRVARRQTEWRRSGRGRF